MISNIVVLRLRTACAQKVRSGRMHRRCVQNACAEGALGVRRKCARNVCAESALLVQFLRWEVFVGSCAPAMC